VVVTSIVSAANRVPSLTLKTQWPTATGVTLNAPLPLEGETAAIALHEFEVPLATVLTVNVPLKPASVAVKVCAAPAPVVINERAEGARTITDEPGVGDAVGVGEGAGESVVVGDGVAVGDGDTEAPGVGEGVGDAVVVGVGVVTADVEAVPPAPLHAGTAVPTASAAAMDSQSRDVTNGPREKRGCRTATSRVGGKRLPTRLPAGARRSTRRHPLRARACRTQGFLCETPSWILVERLPANRPTASNSASKASTSVKSAKGSRGPDNIVEALRRSEHGGNPTWREASPVEFPPMPSRAPLRYRPQRSRQMLRPRRARAEHDGVKDRSI